ncbi:AbrB/MazE/SpoVT family DNA-binding domain-containing protein [Candidatus Woesearchaeota archaeon]|nr:AbrB/MazE/SpoVT family DNA-binding domain-containing protein [Candidatus Woesearchaeota archaeon]
MKRKIIEHGTSNAIILPKKWFDKYGLKRGEEVDIEQAGPMLIVNAEKIRSKQELIQIEQQYFVPYVHRVIGKLFQAGYDHIAVKISDAKDMEEAEKEALKNVMGLEVIKKTDKEIAFDIIISDTPEQYAKYERKVFQTAIEYSKFILDLIEKKEYAKLGDRAVEMLNNKFSVFCERYINKTMSKNCVFKYVILWNLEKITDEYKYLAQYVKEQKIKVSKETKDYFRESIQYLEDLYNLYYSFELATYSSMYQRKIQLLNKGQNLYLEKKSPEAMVVVKLMNVIQGVFDCIGNMLVLNISKCTATKILEKQD